MSNMTKDTMSMCTNWPCQRPRNHPGPCSSSTPEAPTSKQRVDQRLRSKVGGFLLEPDTADGGDTLAIALCSYFERHMSRPKDDPDTENGWGQWAETKTNAALDALTKALMPPDETSARRLQRTPMDYALEHAEYLAIAAEGFMEDVNNLDAATMAIEEDDSDTTRQSLHEAFDRALEARSEGLSTLRSRVYEFRKRAERAKSSPVEPEPDKTSSEWCVHLTTFDECPYGCTLIAPPEASIMKAQARSPRRVEPAGAYTNEAPAHPPILPERFNSTSTPEKAGCALCAEGMNSFADPATGNRMHARNGVVTVCTAQNGDEHQ